MEKPKDSRLRKLAALIAIFGLTFIVGIAIFPPKGREIQIVELDVTEPQPVDYRTAELVFTTYDLLQRRHYDQSRVVPHTLLNTALQGMATRLEKEGLDFSPAPIDPKTSLPAAKQEFALQLDMVKNLLIVSGHKQVADGLALAATRAMLESFHDSHTALVPPFDYREYTRNDWLDEFPSGLRLIALREDFIYVDRVVPASPAEGAGLRRFDRLISLEGERLTGGLAQIQLILISKVRDLQRKSREPVMILELEAEVVRQGETSRHQLPFPNGMGLPCYLWDQLSYRDYHLIHIFLKEFRTYQSQNGEWVNIATLAVQRLLRDHKADGFILDLRANLGGSQADLEETLQLFLPAGRSTFTVWKNSEPEQHKVLSGKTPFKMPLVILVDRHTYSGGELLAQILKEHGRAKIIGETTSGSVETCNIFEIPPEKVVTISIATGRVTTSYGLDLEGRGVTPDFVVPLTEADIFSGRDPQLERAKEILAQEIEQNKK